MEKAQSSQAPARSAPPHSAPPHRRSRLWLAWLALAALAALAWFWGPIHGRAQTAASYGAHVACSCRFIGGRDLDDCRKDFEPGMGLVTLGEDPEAKSVTARFPLLSTQTATYREGRGCQLQPWDD